VGIIAVAVLALPLLPTQYSVWQQMQQCSTAVFSTRANTHKTQGGAHFMSTVRMSTVTVSWHPNFLLQSRTLWTKM
jgi:hypothetical protein